LPPKSFPGEREKVQSKGEGGVKGHKGGDDLAGGGKKKGCDLGKRLVGRKALSKRGLQGKAFPSQWKKKKENTRTRVTQMVGFRKGGSDSVEPKKKRSGWEKDGELRVGRERTA